MMFSILFLLFMPIPQVRTGSLLTGTYDPNSTALINEIRDIKEIDVLRQIINQETLIRVAVVKDVQAVVDDLSSVKRSMASSETMVSTLQQTLESLKSQVDSLNRDNTLAQKVETLQRQVYTLRQDKTLEKRVETLERQVNTLSQDKALQRKVEILQRKVDSLTEEQIREKENWHEKIQEIEQKFNRNITEVYELLNNRTLETIIKDFKLYVDCKHYYLQGQTQSGVYRISPFGNESQIEVYCDMVTEGGGWTAIQKRVSGSESFDRTWAEYKNGFGFPDDSYWIGNDAIHQLTKGRNSSLYVSITLKNGTTFYELYQQFSINDEADNYSLFLGGPATGTLVDSMLHTGNSDYNLSGMSFSTPDRDNDRYSGNCAALSTIRGGWWFNNCHAAFLNIQWSPAVWSWPWWPTVRSGTDVKETMMLVRRH
ncbi:fibrinogen-like protein 1 [Saccostrea echinata]|uniref:fibrinogen-like protein 1 n=1 Tax=Saccostrea echinata TaxID=191078 RepID=UPI002A825845|nr:fibrinogen-like protein 1 [Saccostrea echinata]